jgi:hypothetical protein
MKSTDTDDFLPRSTIMRPFKYSTFPIFERKPYASIDAEAWAAPRFEEKKLYLKFHASDMYYADMQPLVYMTLVTYW